MNRRNYTVHLALAAALVLLAAVAGQVSRWDWRGHVTGPRLSVRVETPQRDEAEDTDAAPQTSGPENNYRHEVLVRFRHGVSEERIQSIAARLHDRGDHD